MSVSECGVCVFYRSSVPGTPRARVWAVVSQPSVRTLGRLMRPGALAAERGPRRTDLREGRPCVPQMLPREDGPILINICRVINFPDRLELITSSALVQVHRRKDSRVALLKLISMYLHHVERGGPIDSSIPLPRAPAVSRLGTPCGQRRKSGCSPASQPLKGIYTT